ncbi:S1C family serine protease, partial [Actinoplanes utahensis]|uniref:S1C family serine protease n=1 Tax=Actinoplanes utahensis TaxID=1869 RepID=UPI0007C83BBD
MSTSFEPFTPANGSGGRRRSQEWPDSWQDDRSWGDTQAQDPWAQPVYQQPVYQQPVYQQPVHQQPVYQQPIHQEQVYQEQVYQASQPVYQVPQPVHQAPPPALPGKERRGRAKPIIIGLVVALVAVSGWQAFRVESMIQSSNDLAERVSTSQGKTEELEKRLTSVFDSEGVAEGVLPSVFRVRAGEFTGTAFAIGRAGGRTNLFTNFHVVQEVWEAGDRTVALERGSTRVNATIVKVSEAKDLALLRTEKDVTPLQVAPGSVKSGQQVMVVGAPLGLEDSVTTGVISAFRTTEDGPTIQFDAPINPGNSGGPVVDANKRVVGLATAKARDAEGIGLAIPIATACQTLGACNVP